MHGTHNKLLEMCKNAICVTNARGCFKLFVKSTLYSNIILCGRGHQKGIKVDGRDFFGGGEETPSSARPNFFRLIFGQRKKFFGGGQLRRLRGLLNRDEVMQIRMLGGCEDFVSE